MKRFFSVLLIIAVASHFGTIGVFAQKRLKPRELIVIEFTTPGNNLNKREVLINRTPKTNYKTAGGGAAGGGNCEAQKTFTVYRHQSTKIQLDCEISLIAYYGLESENEN